MTLVLVATDSDTLFDTAAAALAEDSRTVGRIGRGDVLTEAVRRQQPTVVVCDLQIGNMGGMAACLDLRMEAQMGRAPQTRVLLLLDREADRYLAQQAGADAWMVKPVSAVALQRAVAGLTTGQIVATG